MDVAPVTAFETGTNTWRRLTAWPSGCASGCRVTPTPLSLAPAGRSRFGTRRVRRRGVRRICVRSGEAGAVPRAADPAGRLRQRHDVVAVARRRSARGVGPARRAGFTSDVLKAPVKISGQPVANLVASTSGTDADWVVKLIDVYPDEVAAQPVMGGYQLMIAGRHLPRPLPREASRTRRRSPPTRRCRTASRCRRRTTCSCRATA